MKKYNYYFWNVPITRKMFLKGVHYMWKNRVDEYGHYSYVGYRAEEIN